jgi:hypothetical protein
MHNKQNQKQKQKSRRGQIYVSYSRQVTAAATALNASVFKGVGLYWCPRKSRCGRNCCRSSCTFGCLDTHTAHKPFFFCVLIVCGNEGRTVKACVLTCLRARIVTWGWLILVRSFAVIVRMWAKICDWSGAWSLQNWQVGGSTGIDGWAGLALAGGGWHERQCHVTFAPSIWI